MLYEEEINISDILERCFQAAVCHCCHSLTLLLIRWIDIMSLLRFTVSKTST